MSSMNMLLSFLNREHYQIYYTPIARYLKSVDAAILFSELVQRHQYHQARQELQAVAGKGEGWFYHTQEAMEDRLALGRKTQDRAIEILKEFKLIEVMRFGLPCKRYFRINSEGFEELSKNLSSLSKTDKLECPKRTNQDDHSGQTAPYIEDPNEEPKEEREKAAPSIPTPSSKKKKKSSSPLEPKTFYREKVSLTPDQHGKLLELYGTEKFQWMLDYLDAKKGANGYDYESDYHVLLPANWVNDAFEKEKSTAKSAPKNETIENSKLAQKIWDKCKGRSQNDISLSSKYIEFINGVNAPSTVLEFDNKDFKVKAAEELRKRNIRIN